MKLFLSSYRIPSAEALCELIAKNPDKTSIGVIPNAGDYYAKRARDYKINETRKYLENLGFHTALIDLHDYTDETSLDRALSEIDALWVSGGNTFCLREAMQLSSFDQTIAKHLRKGLVYCGESAGAIVAGQSLEGIEAADEPAFAKKVIHEGLKLVPYYICPHSDNALFATSTAELRELHGNNPHYVELKDTECMIVDGEEMQIIESKS